MKREQELLMLGATVLIVLAAVVFSLFLPVYRETAAVKLPKTQAVLPEGAGSALPAALNPVEINPDTVQAVIATLHRPDSYSRNLTVTSLWEGGSYSEQVQVWVKNGLLRLHMQGQDGALRDYLLEPDRVTLWYDGDSSERFVYASASPALGDSLQRIPSYETVLNLDPAQIRQAGYLLAEDGSGCILVAVDNPSFGYLDVYYISLETGLLNSAESWDGSKLIYQMVAGSAELSAPEDWVFTVSPQSPSR